MLKKWSNPVSHNSRANENIPMENEKAPKNENTEIQNNKPTIQFYDVDDWD